jgi:hypothetical protein
MKKEKIKCSVKKGLQATRKDGIPLLAYGQEIDNGLTI